METALATEHDDVEDGLSVFLSVRSRLFAIAQRILGSAAEAEEIVQDVWIRWQMTDRSLVRDAGAFLSTTATRLAINVMQSAHSRREISAPTFFDPADPSQNPATETERVERLDSAISLLMERLSPRERAAYILREAFGCPYRDIAFALRLEVANTRQLVTRARQRIARGHSAPAAPFEQRRLLEAFIVAARNDDITHLKRLLTSEPVPRQASDAAAEVDAIPA